MNIRHNEALREKLASEYVLGTLRGGARRRFETWLGDDAALRRTVAEWQDRLYPLAELSPAIRPAAHVWQRIETRIKGESSETRRAMRPGWRDSLAFWRSLGLVSTAAAAVLAVALLARQAALDVTVPDYVAVLSDEHAHAAMLITGNAKRSRVTVKTVMPQNIANDKSLELWALPAGGAPRSLGLVAANGEVTLTLPENMPPQSIPALAISLEPKGGSPNPNAPTGPVLFKGAWVQL